MTEIDPRALRDAFGAFLTGVTVVTAVGPDGARRGFTANSFASVSLEPPLLLVCPARRLSSFAVFEACENFAVSVLAEGQEDVSNIFAGFKGDRFAQIAWRDAANGAPIIDGAAAHFACRAWRIAPAGDHSVLIGEVVDFARSGRRGLGYAAGEYFSLGLEREAAAAAAGARKAIAGAIVEHKGAVLLQETPTGFEPPSVAPPRGARTRDALRAALAEAGLDVTLGKAYSIFEDPSRDAQLTYFRARAATGATGGLGRFIPVAELGDLRFSSEALRAMLARYAVEYRTSSFNLYVGDERDGDIHHL